jgi:hypothetical protein
MEVLTMSDLTTIIILVIMVLAVIRLNRGIGWG